MSDNNNNTTIPNLGPNKLILPQSIDSSCITCDNRKMDGVSVASKIRNRSKGSKKTPTIVLNATAENFSHLVQRFTGRRGPTGPSRGPVNINFEQKDGFEDESRITWGDNNSQQPDDQLLGLHMQAENGLEQVLIEEEQDRFFSFRDDIINVGDQIPSGSGYSNSNQMENGLFLDDMYFIA